MTDQHLIDAPSNELIDAWADKYEGHMPEWVIRHVAAEAAQWGADQELKACCALMNDWGLNKTDLRVARRPSLKQQAFGALAIAFVENKEMFSPAVQRFICKALEKLPND